MLDTIRHRQEIAELTSGHGPFGEMEDIGRADAERTAEAATRRRDHFMMLGC
jgi:hypothetical protein